MSAVLKLTDVSLNRGPKEILKHITWTVEKGENWAILGLNGSGKSTLLKLVMAEMWRSSGDVEVLGTKFGQDEIVGLRQKIAIVGSFIAERFNPASKAENLVYTGKFNASMIYKAFRDEDLDEARALLRLIGGEALIGRTYGTLSQGEKQLVLIARSLILHPEILILDEATNGLDLFAKENLLEKLHDVATMLEAPTMLYITHHPDEIREDFHKILLLKNGEITAQGPVSEILTTETLTDFYQKPIQIEKFEKRYFVIPA
ncbi:MAG: ABC transporter ATP-binding protein [Streptococcaceae bacterium]|jgi:iron complex transport system ATP-binding protein|nr:ABC transporter ATP-binding protein [Streptococcaceae bacterium]